MSGSSIGAAAGLVVAAVGAYFTGGATLAAYGAAFAQYAGAAITVGAAIGNMLMPPKGPQNNGPRLNDLTVQTSTYGAFIPRAYATLAMWGNIFWLENGKLKEVATKAKKGGKGGMMGGGGSAGTTYSYFATFALGLLDCSGGTPIVGIRRIWIGPKLIYDAGSSDHATLIASNATAKGFKVYTGTDTQLADPRMQATLGVNNVPAYRGLAYIVFYDLALADHGNSLVAAQIKCEVVCSGSVNYVLELDSSIAATADNIFHSNNSNYLYTLGSSNPVWSIYDISTPTTPVFVNSLTLSSVTLGGSVTWTLMAVDSNYAYILGNGHGDFTDVNIYDIFNPAGPIFKGSVAISFNAKAIAAKNYYVMAASSYGGNIKMIDATIPTAPVIVATLGGMTDIVNIVMGDYYAYALDSSSAVYVIDIKYKESISVVATISSLTDSAYMVLEGNYLYVNSHLGGHFYIIDISSPTAPATVYSSTAYAGGPIDIDIGYLYLGRTRDSSDFTVYSLSNPILPVLIGSITSTSAAGANGFRGLTAYGNYIYTYNNANNHIETFFFIEGHINGATVPLSYIVQAEALTSNLLTASDLDVTALTSAVRGYRVSQIGSIRGGIEPLQGAWPFDVIQHGYKIKFVPRGGSSVVTVDSTLLDARAAGQKPGVQITNSREMDSILPQKVQLKYFDVTREYDTGEQNAERVNTDAVNLLSIDMAIVFNANEAAGKAQVLLYLYWMERYDIAFVLPPEYNNLEPADVITITSDQATYVLRLTAINYTSDGRLECKAKFNDAAIYTPTALGQEGQFTGVSMIISGNTLYSLLDIPLIQDVYDTPGFPVAMTGYNAGWPGGELFRSADNGQTWDGIQGFEPPGSVMGIGVATTVLATHSGTTLDKSGVLTVLMTQSTISSVTEAQMFAGSNWFAYGSDQRWEIIAVQNCVLQSDGTYVLTDFLRGQFGTEWATGLHVVGDSFVHLSSSELAFVAMNLTYIGIEAKYRGITSGSLIDSDTDRAFTYRGVNLECLSPCQLTGNRNPSTNDLTLIWTRRTRFAGWRDAVDAALGEVAESYEIDIYADINYASVKRTIAVATPTAIYTNAQQTTDFGTNAAHAYWRLYVTANNGDATYTDFNEVEFRATAGGTDQSTGGTALAGSTYPSYPASSAFDDNNATYCILQAGLPNYIGYHFTSPVFVGEFAITSTHTGESTRGPKNFNLQYSDDGAAWTTAYSVAGQTAWGTEEKRLFSTGLIDITTMPLYVKIYQLSANVGRGYPLTATLTR